MTLPEAKRILTSLGRIAGNDELSLLAAINGQKEETYELILMTDGKPGKKAYVTADAEHEYFNLGLDDPEGSPEPEEPFWEIIIKGERIYHDITLIDNETPYEECFALKRIPISEGEPTLLTLESLLKNLFIAREGSEIFVNVLEFCSRLPEDRNGGRDDN